MQKQRGRVESKMYEVDMKKCRIYILKIPPQEYALWMIKQYCRTMPRSAPALNGWPTVSGDREVTDKGREDEETVS